MRVAGSTTAALACLAGAALGGCAPEDSGAGPVDVCKPHDGAAPVVVVGQGREAFVELGDHEVVQLEAGAQGGHHVWLAVWVTGLERTGSVLSLRGFFPQLGVEIPPFTAGVTFHEAEGHAGCELFGIRFQVDRGLGIEEVLGQTLEVEITIEDTMGDVGTGSKTMTLAGSSSS